MFAEASAPKLSTQLARGVRYITKVNLVTPPPRATLTLSTKKSQYAYRNAGLVPALRSPRTIMGFYFPASVPPSQRKKHKQTQIQQTHTARRRQKKKNTNSAKHQYNCSKIKHTTHKAYKSKTRKVSHDRQKKSRTI